MNNYLAAINKHLNQSPMRSMHTAMNPLGVLYREARDSKQNANSYPIIVALDVTQSMTSYCNYLMREGFEDFVSKLVRKGVDNPALLFMALGDHLCDQYPLQVGQFETNDAGFDKWLKRTFLEFGGGANQGESYLLAWYFAAFHTQSDAWDQRRQKGVLVTIGDEPVLSVLSASALKRIMGQADHGYSVDELFACVKECYDVYHIHMDTPYREAAKKQWQRLLGKNCIVLSDVADVVMAIGAIVYSSYCSANKKASQYNDPRAIEML